jgi:hypothetical protein
VSDTQASECKCGCECGSDNAECKCGCDCSRPPDEQGRTAWLKQNGWVASDTQTRLDEIKGLIETHWPWGLRDDGRFLLAELERVTAENDRLRAALSSALANEAQWWKKAQAALSPTYGPVGSLDGKGGVGL